MKTDYTKFTDEYINTLTMDELRRFIYKTADAINKRLLRMNQQPKTDAEKIKAKIQLESEFIKTWKTAYQYGNNYGFIQDASTANKVPFMRRTFQKENDIDKLREVLKQNIKILTTSTPSKHFKNVLKEANIKESTLQNMSYESYITARQKADRQFTDYNPDDFEVEYTESQRNAIRKLGSKFAGGDIDAGRKLLRRGIISEEDFNKAVENLKKPKIKKITMVI